MIRLWPCNWTLPEWSFGSEGQVRWCGPSPDGQTLATGIRNGTILLWDTEPRNEELLASFGTNAPPTVPEPPWQPQWVRPNAQTAID